MRYTTATGSDMAEEQDLDFSKLSVEEKCQHKVGVVSLIFISSNCYTVLTLIIIQNWKARVSGYEELTTIFQTQTDDKSNEFAKYAPFIKKLVVDTNAAAQEKGIYFAAIYPYLIFCGEIIISAKQIYSSI